MHISLPKAAFAVCTMAALAIGSSTAQANFPFSTSFEPPDWTLGDAGQNGWNSFGTGWIVVDTFARTGTQSVRWENPPGGTWLESPQYGISGGDTTHTSVWVYIEGNTDATRRFGLQAFSATGMALGSNSAINFRSDGQVWGNTTSGTQVFTGVTISNPTDRWIEVSLQMTLETGGSVIGSVDGQVIPLFSLTGADPGLGTIDLYATGSGNGVAFFDDYAAIPEPMGVFGLLAGAGLLAIRRRRVA